LLEPLLSPLHSPGSMTHNETRLHWLNEGVIALGTGTLFGMTSVIVGKESVIASRGQPWLAS